MKNCKKSILLLHGWNYRNYTSQTYETDAWHNRKKLVSKLSENYQVYSLNFPGFCGQKEPSQAWDLTQFAYYVKDYIEKNNLQIDYLLGYSFGGAVAIRYKNIFQDHLKIILVSPAIIRNNKNSKTFKKTPKCLDFIRKKARNIYLIYKVKTKEMVYGTKFLRNTYQSIVRENLLDEINRIPTNNFIIIYGKEDNQVNPLKVATTLEKKHSKNIKWIEHGGHDIGNTHTIEIMKYINEFSKIN